jgi:hypothetical protein
MTVVASNTIQSILGANPIHENVEGSPFQPGDLIRVVGCCDEVGKSVGIDKLVGRFGVVKHLEYECGSGQTYPADPMIGVRFRDGPSIEFWKEELLLVRRLQ